MSNIQKLKSPFHSNHAEHSADFICDLVDEKRVLRKSIEAKDKEIQALKDEVERLKDALETENNFSTGNYQMYKIAKSMLSENQVKNLHEKLGADRCC